MEEGRGRLALADALALLVAGLAVRVALVLAHPAVHGGDSAHRIARSDTLLLAYHLPLAQALVFLTRAFHPDPFWTRLAFSTVGALAAVALAAVVAEISGRVAGRAAGTLLAFHPLFVYYSIVPYQESLMLLLVLAGALSLLRGRTGAASLAFGLACLTRYEAWIAAGLAAIGHRGRPLRALGLFGWAPALWMLAWRGLSPSGTYVLDLDPEAGRLSRLVFLLGKVREYSGDALLVLAAVGAVVVAQRRDRRWAWALVYLTTFLAAATVAGHEFPTGSGRISERMAHIPAAALCALAGVALGALAERGATARGRIPLGVPAAAAIVCLLAVGWAHRSDTLVTAAGEDSSLRLAVETARVAHHHLPPGGRLAVAGPPVGEAAVADFVRKVERSGGDAPQARALAASLASHAPDLDRIAAQLPRPPGTVVPAGTSPADLLAVFDDAPDRERLREGRVVARIEARGRGVTVYALETAGP